MKILAIRGKNLASLAEEFAIDFTLEPLRSAGIFAITGPTGSGKSTLLDALCLALYNNTPRVSRDSVESLPLRDGGDKYISQKDPRNVLRRNAIEGYAQVDFRALDGKRYRSTWFVRRAYNKADGNLREATMQLENLENSSIEQDGKTAVLERVVSLIGLTFEQFTRTVLLAQGDFATFLKARQGEKAELLEKLTGTEIYSRISKRIYEQTKMASESLALIEEKLKGVHPLTKEEYSQKQTEKEKGKEEEEALKLIKYDVERHLRWLARSLQLDSDIEMAILEKEKWEEQKKEAFIRFQKIEDWGKAKELEDVFREEQKAKEALSRIKKDYQSFYEKVQSCEEKQREMQADLLKKQAQKKLIEQEWEAHQGPIEKAKGIEAQLQWTKEALEKSEKEWNAVQKEKENLDKRIENESKKKEEYQKILQESLAFFEKYKPYEKLIQKAEYLSDILERMDLNKTAITDTENLLQETINLLKSEEEKLLSLEEERQRLEHLLPAEVLVLRSKLKEGEACLVCGSMHHPSVSLWQQSEISTIQEKELEENRTKLQFDLQRMKEGMDKTRLVLLKRETLLESYKKQWAEDHKQIDEAFHVWPRWQEDLDKGELKSRWLALVSIWKEKEESEKQSRSVLKELEEHWPFLMQQWENRKGKCLELGREKEEERKERENLQKESIALLKGFTILELEAKYRKAKEEIEKDIESFTSQLNIIRSTLDQGTGTLASLKKVGLEREKEIEKEEEEIEKGLQIMAISKPYFNRAYLEFLSTWSVIEVEIEKKYLQELSAKGIAIEAKYRERLSQRSLHEGSKDKPTQEVDIAVLEEKEKKISEREQIVKQDLAEVEAILKYHQENLLRVEEYRKECDQKQQEKERWAKLNMVFGSANGDVFKKIAQAYTLDMLLIYANQHLEKLVGRYVLQRVPNSLGLQVVDTDMMYECRSVHTLSGGESFLVSLALALGLSSLSSSRMEVQSLFIDEGFGSLDTETLSVAMDALENLQSQGRKIGVISHVSEMTEKIVCKIQVMKGHNGNSRIRIL